MRKSRFSEQMSIGTSVPSQSSALRLVSSLNTCILSAKAFDIIISSQPLSTNVLQGKLSVGPPTFPLKTSKACLFETLLSLYGENVQTFMVVPLNSFCSFMSFSFLFFLSFCSFGSFYFFFLCFLYFFFVVFFSFFCLFFFSLLFIGLFVQVFCLSAERL